MSELRRFPGLCLASPGATGRKRADRYVREVDRVTGEIREDIGFAGGGFPYATREEIAEWVGGPADGPCYPCWVREAEPAAAELVEAPTRR